MVRRHAKRSRKYHGTRSWGRGNIKHGRGKGSKGGKGYGGGHKQKWTWMMRYEPEHFKRKPMTSLKKKRPKTINIWELNKLALDGELKKGEDGRYRADLPDFKVLGTGRLEFPMTVIAASFSKSAAEKIRSSGGEARTAAQGGEA